MCVEVPISRVVKSAKPDTKELLSPHPDTQWKRAWCQTSCILIYYYGAKDLRYELRARGSLGARVPSRQPQHGHILCKLSPQRIEWGLQTSARLKAHT